ncbi:MAG TPA: DUF6326 family protein [Acidimicrobiia bacterium]|nr:DUF6326 family protein [Acidimicrobiia bacterium]
MRSDEQNPQRLEDVQVPVRLKLSAMWVSAMFLYVYVDIFAFYKPGTIDDIMVGRVWEFDITQGWALGALVLMTIPSLMVFLSLGLPARVARWANVVVASLFVLVSIGNALGETWAFYWFGSAVEAALLLLIIWYAWTWPRLVDRVAGQ